MVLKKKIRNFLEKYCVKTKTKLFTGDIQFRVVSKNEANSFFSKSFCNVIVGQYLF